MFNLGFFSSPNSTVKDSDGLVDVSEVLPPLDSVLASPFLSSDLSLLESGVITKLSLEIDDVRLRAGVFLSLIKDFSCSGEVM